VQNSLIHACRFESGLVQNPKTHYSHSNFTEVCSTVYVSVLVFSFDDGYKICFLCLSKS